jgi:hypothetical protein
MSGAVSTITIGIDPTIEIGPLTLAWHGITIALGILIGGVVARGEARRRGLNPEPLYPIGMILVAGALVGGRLYYLAEHGQLLDVGAWFDTRGFTFYGGFIATALGITRRLGLSYRLCVGSKPKWSESGAGWFGRSPWVWLRRGRGRPNAAFPTD